MLFYIHTAYSLTLAEILGKLHWRLQYISGINYMRNIRKPGWRKIGKGLADIVSNQNKKKIVKIMKTKTSIVRHTYTPLYIYIYIYIYIYVCVCVCVCVRVHVWSCMSVCVCVCACKHELWKKKNLRDEFI